MDTQEFVDLSILKHGKKYNYNNTVYKDYKTMVEIECPLHGIFKVVPYNHFKLNAGCPVCLKETKQITRKDFVEKVIKLYGNKFNLDETVYTSPKERVTVYNRDKKCYEEYRAETLMYKHNVKTDKKHIKYTLESVIEASNKKHNYKFDYSKFIFTTLKNKSIIICPIHGEFEMNMDRHITKGQGCRKCGYIKNSINQRKDNNHFKANGNRVHNGFYTYDKVEYVDNKTNVIVTCPIHGDFETRPDNHIGNKSGCPICKLPKGELKLRDILIKLNIEFQQQYVIKGSIYKYDFYLPKLNILLEYDGEQHFRPVEAFGGEKEFKITKARDIIKNHLAKKNGYRLIRLSYLELNNLELNFIHKLMKFYKYYYKGIFIERGSYLMYLLENDNIKEYLFKNYRLDKVLIK